jgi:hypothetical protein
LTRMYGPAVGGPTSVRSLLMAHSERPCPDSEFTPEGFQFCAEK